MLEIKLTQLEINLCQFTRKAKQVLMYTDQNDILDYEHALIKVLKFWM